MASRRSSGRFSRKHMARQQRERRQSNIIMTGSIAVVAIVILLVVYGLVVSQIIEPRQPVAIVNEEEISTREFQARVRYERNLLINQYLNTQNNMLIFGSDPQFQSFFQNQLQQIEFQLEPTTLGRSVLNALIEDRLIRQEAVAREISVPASEVEKSLEEFFGYFGGNQPPTPTDFPTSEPTSTLTVLQETLVAPPPTATALITATTTVTATTVPDEGNGAASATPELTATPVVTITATPFPTATPYTLDAFETDFNETVDFLDGAYGFTEADLRRLIESRLLRERLQAEITANFARSQEQVWARHILVPEESEALAAIERLNDGEDFATLAAELSIDTSNAFNGGDLGWFSRGRMVTEFENAAFDLEVGQISEPVETQFGWHIIQVIGHEERPLSGSEYEQAQAAEFGEWLTMAREDADVEILDYWEDRTPSDPILPQTSALPQIQATP